METEVGGKSADGGLPMGKDKRQDACFYVYDRGWGFAAFGDLAQAGWLRIIRVHAHARAKTDRCVKHEF